ncbi:DUF1454 family protein [Citrobacter sp. JGM124]|uniref:DUF1454 family protein n=1 Tax=Citrobacter sp. JGM124 TaxID=2799789 RepID=UPI001BAACFE7|nr:DUF1454 family protein [Citrobacter sp. JGM124]MBS0849730.1 DUF1454 family protein [Citrobacter sp. JGM124]
MLIKYLLPAIALLFVSPVALSQTGGASVMKVAPYLLPNAPTFDLTITQFRNAFNNDNPTLPLNEFRAIESSRDKANLTRAATTINERLYASAALERGTLKIKSLQITWLPAKSSEQKTTKEKATEYIAAIIRSFTPSLSKQQSLEKTNKLLNDSRNKRYFSQNDGPLRYVIVDNGDKGLTFAVEPIKLMLSDTLSNNG